LQCLYRQLRHLQWCDLQHLLGLRFWLLEGFYHLDLPCLHNLLGWYLHLHCLQCDCRCRLLDLLYLRLRVLPREFLHFCCQHRLRSLHCLRIWQIPIRCLLIICRHCVLQLRDQLRYLHRRKLLSVLCLQDSLLLGHPQQRLHWVPGELRHMHWYHVCYLQCLRFGLLPGFYQFHLQSLHSLHNRHIRFYHLRHV
jgi:hypothetical protein